MIKLFAAKFSRRKLLKRRLPAFNLLEIILVVSLVAIMAAIIMPVAGSFYNSNVLDSGVMETVTALRRAQALASAAAYDDSWGVYLSDSQLAIFKGASYSGRDNFYDEVMSLGGVYISSPQEIIFNKLTATPQLPTSLMLYAFSGQETKEIIVSQQGVINY